MDCDDRTGAMSDDEVTAKSDALLNGAGANALDVKVRMAFQVMF
jgi:hypothetical protein